MRPLDWLPFGIGGSTVLGVVAAVVVVLGVVVALICAVLLTHHVISARRRNRHRTLVKRASEFLAVPLADGRNLSQAVDVARRRFGYKPVVEILRRARVELRGDRAAEISALLGAMGEVARLSQDVDARRAWRRATAIRGLAECGGDEARRHLFSATRDPDPEVRRAARDGLLNDGHKTAIEAAIRCFLEDVPRRSGWRRSFYARLSAVSPGALRDLVAGGTLDPEQEKLALEALGDARDTGVLPLVWVRLSSPNAELRATAVRVVGKLDDQTSLHALLDALDDKEWFVRAAAARAFERMPVDAQVCEALGRRLSDSSWWVRSNAAHTLARHGDQGAQVLIDSLRGGDKYARDGALAALALVTLSPAVREQLERLLPTLAGDPTAAAEVRMVTAVAEVSDL